MRVKVLAKIQGETVQSIIDSYNSSKSDDEPPLQWLDRAEGGFKIDLPSDKWKKDSRTGYIDANNKIRQVRLFNGYLLAGIDNISFTAKQYMLLYDVLIQCLPPGTVLLED